MPRVTGNKYALYGCPMSLNIPLSREKGATENPVSRSSA